MTISSDCTPDCTSVHIPLNNWPRFWLAHVFYFSVSRIKKNYERVFNTHTELHVADGEHRWQTVHISPPSVCEVESFEANAGYLAHGALVVNVSTYMKNTVASVWCGLSGPTFQGDFCVITLFAFGMWRPCCCFLFLAHSSSRRAKFFHWMTEG